MVVQLVNPFPVQLSVTLHVERECVWLLTHVPALWATLERDALTEVHIHGYHYHVDEYYSMQF